MGANACSLSANELKHIVSKEFENHVKSKKRDYLVLSEVLKLDPPDDLKINFHHLGNLFCLDFNKDGRFSVDDFETFSAISLEKIRKFKPHEIQAQLQAYNTLNMWLSVRKREEEDDFVGWIGRILYENQPVVYFSDRPEVPFIKAESIKLLYEIMNVKLTHNYDFQQFFDLLQQVGEETGLMKIEMEELDNFLPLLVVQQFARDFIRGFSKLMLEIGFKKINI